MVEEQGREIADLRRRLDETSSLALAARNELAELREKPPATSVPAAVEERLARMEQDVHRFPELAEQAVTAGEFPGSMRIPGSDAALRIGGLVRMTSVNSFDAIGTEDRFVTSSIPVEGSEAARQGDRTTYTAAPSRFNFDLRTPTGVGAMRAFIEGDFAGSGLRQPVPAPPRLRPVAEAHGRADLVDLLRPRSRARAGSTARA